jgi:hypothetical protein
MTADFDESIQDFLKHEEKLHDLINRRDESLFHLLQPDPSFMKRLKATSSFEDFKFFPGIDRYKGRQKKLELLKKKARVIAGTIRKLIHLYDKHDKEGYIFTAQSTKASVWVKFHNQPFLRTPYLASILRTLQKPIVWSAPSDAIFTYEDLLKRSSDSNLTVEEWALLYESFAREPQLLHSVERISNEEFERIHEVPGIEELIRRLSFWPDKRAVLIRWSSARSSFVLLRRNSHSTGFGNAEGKRVLDYVPLYMVDFDVPFSPELLKQLSFRTGASKHRHEMAAATCEDKLIEGRATQRNDSGGQEK